MSNNQHHILLVEDEPSLTTLYRTILEKHFQLDIVSDFTAAKTYLSSHQPELILLDLIIPFAQGQAPNFSQRLGVDLLKLKEINNIPVIVFTNLDDEQDKTETKKLGAKEYIVKANILPAQLVEKISSML